jgi:hypothetical protein
MQKKEDIYISHAEGEYFQGVELWPSWMTFEN